jgi:chromosome segregation ATPase
MNRFLMNRVWYTVFDDADGNPQNPPTPPTPPQDKPTKTYTQEQLNAMLAEDRKKHQSAIQNTLAEVEALKARSQLTQQERDELDARLQEMSRSLLTKEELAKKDLEKAQRKHKEELDTLSKERDSWKTRHETSTILRAIADAANDQQAFSSEQITAILQPNTRLVEVLDDGRPTGQYKPIVKFSDFDSKGKPTELELSPAEAVKRMKEMEKYQNLFKIDSRGGVGGTNRSGLNGKMDAVSIAQRDMSEYMRLRREGKIKLS